MEEEDWTDAVDSYAEAVSIIETEAGPESADLVRPLRDLAIAQGKLGRNKEARENRRKMTAVSKSVHAHAHESLRADAKSKITTLARSQTCVVS